MKIHLISDIHLEFGNKYAPTAIADTIIVAGDIHPRPLEVIKYLEYVATLYNNVIFVTGNHDYYKNDIYETNKYLYEHFRHTNIHFLNNSSVTLDGVKFFGGTMWTDGCGNNDKLLEDSLNDFWLIKDFSVKRMRELHELFKRSFESADVIVTHHVPDVLFTHPMYINSGINGGFSCTDMKRYLHKARVWCFGHTHDNYDKMIGNTRFLCNPIGYPQEFKYVDRDLVFEA